MNRLIIFGIFLVVGISGCKEEDAELIYNSPDNIYIPVNDAQDKFTAFYTFAYSPEKVVDTVFIPVRISGKRVGFERTFGAEIVNEYTTAEEDLHFQPLKEFYTIPADSGSAKIPLILYNKDPLLADTSLTVFIRLKATEHFGLAYVDFIYADIFFSSRLEKPVWWDFWEGQLSIYSRVKHQFYLITAGDEDLISSYEVENYFLYIPRNLFLIDQLRRFLSDPFAWVEEHSDEFALDKQNDNLYHFYNRQNPDNIYELKLLPEDGKFYFHDENGLRVTVN